METEKTEEVVVAPEANEGEGNENEGDFVKLSKEEYDKLNQTLGSLKRENKDLKKPKDDQKETSTTNQPDVLLQKLEKMALRQAGITHQEDIELAQKTAKKWGMDIDEVLADEDFKAKLDRQQTSRANVEATSGVKGGAGGGSAKATPEYWMAKGTPPTPADVPDRKTRQAIVRKMLSASQKATGGFYNE